MPSTEYWCFCRVNNFLQSDFQDPHHHPSYNGSRKHDSVNARKRISLWLRPWKKGPYGIFFHNSRNSSILFSISLYLNVTAINIQHMHNLELSRCSLTYTDHLISLSAILISYVQNNKIIILSSYSRYGLPV